MKKFRLPRKVKKKIKRGLYLYPIKNGDDEREVFEELIKLDKEAFHVTMGGRIRELGKMFEMKYGTKILKL